MGESRKLHNRDRLSELPDSLIITILSSLEMNDAVRTSVLSKRWKDLWTTLPSIKFSGPQYDLDVYRSFINRALLRWKGAKILKFDLRFFDAIPHSHNLDLDSWLLFAIGKRVEELQLWSGIPQVVDSYYSPPQRLYTCSSIRKLNLGFVKLSIPENVQLGQLTSLTVYGSESLSGRGMTRLLSGAPMLEELALVLMDIAKDFNIRSKSLKKLHIGSGEFMTIRLRSVMRIWAPNLSSLEINARVFRYDSCFQLDVPSLTTAILNFYEGSYQDFSHWERFHQVFRSIRHVQSLTLSDWCIELLLHLKKKNMLVEFTNAKRLKLYPDEPVDEMLLGVLEMFPKLLTLAIDVCYASTKDVASFSASEKKVDIPLHHLRTCEIRLYKTNSSILRTIKAMLENAEILEKVVLRVRNEEALGWGALEKVLSMRRSSPNARVVISKER